MKILIYTYALGFILAMGACEKSGSESAALNNSIGAGGSLAKFTIVGNYVYAVSSHYLYTVDISNPAQPLRAGQSALNFDMETLYPYNDKLFIGSKTGLYIYSLEDPAKPKLVGEAKHGRSCDPVVANDSVSYSTLKGSTVCGPVTSGLYVHDIKNLEQPKLKTTIPINDPLGLGMADSALYVCSGSEGLKVYSIKNPYQPVERQTIPGGYCIDVIPYGDILVCWARQGIRLYDITNRLQPQFIKQVSN